MRNLDPYSIRLFMAAAREGSIGRAAAREHIAASALSRRIADLEHAVGAPLLIRSRRGIALTDAGRIVFERGAQMEDYLEALVRDVQMLTEQICGTVRLFANTSAVVGFLPERLKKFCSEFPLVEIALQEHTSDDVVLACMDDRADIGIGVRRAASLPNCLESWHFAEDPLRVIMPHRHILSGKRSFRLAEVLEHPIVGLQRGGSLDQLMQDQAAARHMPMKVSVYVNSTDAACRMVEVGLGIAVIPNSAASAYAGTRRFARRVLDEPWANREIRVFASRKHPRLRAIDALIDALRR